MRYCDSICDGKSLAICDFGLLNAEIASDAIVRFWFAKLIKNTRARYGHRLTVVKLGGLPGGRAVPTKKVLQG